MQIGILTRIYSLSKYSRLLIDAYIPRNDNSAEITIVIIRYEIILIYEDVYLMYLLNEYNKLSKRKSLAIPYRVNL